jgi:hypothetical protein
MIPITPESDEFRNCDDREVHCSNAIHADFGGVAFKMTVVRIYQVVGIDSDRYTVFFPANSVSSFISATALVRRLPLADVRPASPMAVSYQKLRYSKDCHRECVM